MREAIPASRRTFGLAHAGLQPWQVLQIITRGCAKPPLRSVRTLRCLTPSFFTERSGLPLSEVTVSVPVSVRTLIMPSYQAKWIRYWLHFAYVAAAGARVHLIVKRAFRDRDHVFGGHKGGIHLPTRLQ